MSLLTKIGAKTVLGLLKISQLTVWHERRPVWRKPGWGSASHHLTAMSRRNLDKYYSIYSSKPRGVIFNHPEVQASLGFQPGFKRLSPDDPSMHGPDITAYVRQVR
ncbi:hypothetical protein An09g00150 [Aspergillus niger]|uniref:Uncharacterized protein n=2 Tax=Aspergillus niger TaxID=5061 RepID=A2QSY8_ASPNC|nr:hypothetical protein An09g00150 [Aspergillus niger]CAK40103.1 hypothetical protein An09g00150 [Aspergillus niger]